MKALVLADASAWHTQRYVAELRRQGHDVTLVSLQDGEGVDHKLELSRYGEAVSYVSHVKVVKALIDSVRPDVVNAHFASAYGVLAARCRRRYGDCGVGWALTVWGSDILVSPEKSWLHKKRVRYALDSANIILSDSTYLADKTSELTHTPIEVILWGVERKYCADDETLRNRVDRLRRRWRDGELQLFLPRPHRTLYANESLLDALTALLRSGRATMTVNSTGNLFDRFLQRADELGVRQRIRMYQPCSRDEYLRMLQEHDFYLSAATSDSSPVSQIEAQATGVAPVCAEHPGLNDLLCEETRQLCVFDRERADDALKNIEQVCELDAERLFAVLRAGRDIVREKALYEDNIAETALVLERCCRERG